MSLRSEVISSLPWHNTIVRTAAAARPSGKGFSVMQFNLLAKCYEPKHTSDVISYEDRRALNLKHIAGLKPSLLVTEETDPDVIEMLEADGYDKICASRKQTDEGKDDTGEYVAVFARKNSGLKCKRWAMKRIDSSGKRTQFIFLLHMSYAAESAAAAGAGSSGPTMEFLVGAFHAKAGRKDELETERLRDNHNILSNLVPAFAFECANENAREQQQLMSRFMFLGDFNAGPVTYEGKYPCRVVPWLLGEDFEPEEKKKFEEIDGVAGKNPFKFRSAVREVLGQHPLFTTCKHREGSVICQTIDYIFLTEGMGTVTGCLGNPSENPTKDLMPTLLPCPGKHGSDHLSQYVEIDVGAVLQARAMEAAAAADK